MVKQCSITTCRVESYPGNGISCHAFPTKDEALRKKWIAAIPPSLLKKLTKTSCVCSLHFPPENYRNTPLGRNCLKKDAVPSIFKAQKDSDEYIITDERQINALKRCAGEKEALDLAHIHIKEEDMILLEATCPKPEVGTQTSPKRFKPDPRVEELLRKVDLLQKRLKRRDARIKVLDETVKTLKEEVDRSVGIREVLKKHFSDDRKLYLLLNEVNNNDVPPQSRHYSEEIKHLAVTMYFHSSKAYEHLQKYLCLPHPSTIRKWMAKCESDVRSLIEADQDSQSIEVNQDSQSIEADQDSQSIEADQDSQSIEADQDPQLIEVKEEDLQSTEIDEAETELTGDYGTEMEDLKIEVT